MAALAATVLLGVGFRKAGAALVWYDEVAAILLAWLTYYGAALAALRRDHIGVPTVVRALRGTPRRVVIAVSECLVVAFFLVVAWSGLQVLASIGGSTLVSLPWIPARLAQSVIPIGAILFVAAELMSIRDALADPAPPPGGRSRRDGP
jgi:TRAP-type C4-dicarboxylate transport system permease small subunit